MSKVVLTQVADGVRTIALNRPEILNAMNGELVVALGDAFAEANADPGTRAVVFCGHGRAFCAGADLRERGEAISPDTAQRNAESIQRVTREMVFGDKVIVGAIHGWAVGGGFEWAIGRCGEPGPVHSFPRWSGACS